MTEATMRLSICIPTHHGRGPFLKEAVDSILPQISDALRGQVEFCISDNASEDETQELVRGWSEANPGLFRYNRNAENVGFTRNLLRVVDMAQGDYCWLFSSDDTMNSGGLTRVLEVLQEHPGTAGLTVFFRTLNRDLLGPEHPYPAPLLPLEPDRTQAFTSPHQIFYNCGSIMGYTSAQIFDRCLWNETLAEVGEEKFTSFRYFPYLYLFGRMVKKRPCWIWLPEKLANSRLANDYLSAHLDFNQIQYHLSTMEEASNVWGELLGRGSAAYQHLMRSNYRVMWNWFHVIRYKARYQCRFSDDLAALVGFTRRLYFHPGFWATTFPSLLLPNAVARGGANVARDLKLLTLGAKLRALRSPKKAAPEDHENAAA